MGRRKTRKRAPVYTKRCTSSKEQIQAHTHTDTYAHHTYILYT